MAAFEDSDFEKMEEIRARVDSIVEDPATAAEPQGLVPPALQAAVLPRRVPAGLQRAGHAPRRHRRQGRRAHHRDGRRRRRRRVRGRLHHLRVGLRGRHRRTPAAPATTSTGRDGVKLSEYWADGMRTKHGIHVHGFPNLFIVQPTQGANLISNVPAQPHRVGPDDRRRSSSTRSTTGYAEVEVTKEAEDAWIDLLLLRARPGMIGSPDCTPGYYNNEGQDRGPGARASSSATRTGAMAYFQYIDEWRIDGRLRGPRVPVADRHQLEAGRRGRPRTWDTTSSGTGVASSVGSALAGKSNTPIISWTG